MFKIPGKQKEQLMNNWLIFYIGVATLSFILTYIIRLYALKFKIIDIPNIRSSHSIPTPRGGGLAIVICWYLGITIVFATGHIADNLYYALMSGLILAIISLVDDVISLKPMIRLSAQLISAVMAIFFLSLMEFEQ